MANAAARFAAGRGMALEAQANTKDQLDQKPGTMSMMEMYRGTIAVVDAARTKATIAK